MNRNYETHVTLAASNRVTLERARVWAVDRQLKWTHIELERGESPSQPMVTFWGTGNLDQQLARAKQLTKEFVRLGASVVRVKTETTADEAAVLPGDAEQPDRYFEFHLKLLLAQDTDLNGLSALAITHGGRLSRNARRSLAGGRSERFITLREHGCRPGLARERFKQMLAAVERAGHQLLESESEYVVFDSNLSLDDGWF